MAAARAGVDLERAVALGFRSGAAVSADGPTALAAAWTRRRHLILRCGRRLGPAEAADRLASAGVPPEAPALAAAGLGTGRERLLYGSVEDLRTSGFGDEAVLVVPHPAALPMDFAWPPTAAPG